MAPANEDDPAEEAEKGEGMNWFEIVEVTVTGVVFLVLGGVAVAQALSGTWRKR